ncbi:unnamed protein product [Ectocarpus fasciculatus]
MCPSPPPLDLDPSRTILGQLLCLSLSLRAVNRCSLSLSLSLSLSPRRPPRPATHISTVCPGDADRLQQLRSCTVQYMQYSTVQYSTVHARIFPHPRIIIGNRKPSNKKTVYALLAENEDKKSR